MADSERRPGSIRLSPTTVAIGTHKGSIYVADDSLLTDVGFSATTVITANATQTFNMHVDAVKPDGTVTLLFTLGSLPNVTTTSLVNSTVYTITSIGNNTQANWNTCAGTTGVTYAVGSIFTAAASVASSTGTVCAITRPTANDTYGWAGLYINLPDAIRLTGKASATAVVTQADVAINANLESRYYTTDLSNPTGTLYGALPANAPYGGNVISTVKPEFAALGYGYTNRDGIRIPAGTTLRFQADLATSTADNVNLLFATRPGRD